jgi:tetratricopeptide (TPR) repeat protein
MRAAWVSLLTILALLLTISCTRSVLDRAEQYEIAGNNASALQTYEQALARLSERDQRGRSEVLTRIGDCLYRMDRPQEAFSAFQKAVEADHNNTTAHLRMGELFLSGGSAERAREQAMIVLNITSRNNEALSLMGAAWATTDHTDLAKEAYQRVLDNDPKRVTVAVALADLYRRENNDQKAEEILRQAVKSAPGTALPWLALGRLAEQQGNGKAAEDAYRKAVAAEDTPDTNLRMVQFLQRSGRIAEAEQVLRKVDAQRPTYPVALADFQLLSGRPDAALHQYRSSLAQPQPEPKKNWVPGLHNDASAPASDNRADIAARVIEAEIAAIFDRPTNERARNVAGVRSTLNDIRALLDPASIAVLEAELAITDNNLVLARSYAAAATELAPESASAHYILGVVAAASGDTEKAEAEWQSALDADNHFSPARLALAEQALSDSDAETADEQARTVVRDDPGNLHAVTVFARALLKEGKTGAAVIMAQRASALDPTSPEPAIIMGEAALSIKDLPHAMLNFERAMVAQPSSAEAMDGLLRVYRNTSFSYSSLQKLERSAQEPPASGILLEIAGRLYADRGWKSDAIRALKRALATDPQRITAAKMLSELQAGAGEHQASSQVQIAGAQSDPLVQAYQLQQSGEWQKAISSYERTVRLGEPTGVAANNLAFLYADHGAQLDRALALAQAAAQLSPNSPAVLDTLGYVHLRRHEYSEAVKQLETADRLAKVEGGQGELRLQIRKHLHDAYLSAGQTEAAQQVAMLIGRSVR